MLIDSGRPPAGPGSTRGPGGSGGRVGVPGGASWLGLGGHSRAARPAAAVQSADGPATWALAVLTLASAAGMFRVFSTRSWVGPVLATVAVTHLVLWAMRRWRFGPLVAAPVALAAVTLMIMWTVFGSATAMGFPGPWAWSELSRSLGGLGNDFATMTAPVAPTRAFEVLAAGGAGLVAILGDFAAFRWRSPLVAVLAGLAAFVGCCATGVGGGRGWIVGAEVGAICLFVVVERATTAAGTLVWFAGTRPGAARWALIGGGAAGAVALVAAVALTPALTSRDGVGALGWRGADGGRGGERIVPNPIVSLRTRLIRFSDTPVFAVDSTVPSYWRLTSLDTFNGDTWTATGSYRDFGARLPGAAAARPGTRSVRATFQIQQLESVWLPEQFDPVSVRGVRHVSYDEGTGSLITSAATSDGLSYSVDSLQYLNTLSASTLEAAPPVGDSPALSPDLELPAVVDGPITELAARITAGHATEYDKALAIQDYLRSSRFSYTLNPPSDGTGVSALSNFLFVTRQGYCQQFAGAYAVLARAAGLPTRLAVGFATGSPVAGGGFQIYDRDAHTWPEVYFGPGYGWLPFEPTPGFAIPGTSRYTGTAPPVGAGLVPTPTTVPAGSSGSAPPVQKSGTPTTNKTPSTTLAPRATRPAPPGFPAWLAAVAAIPAAAALWAAANLGLRDALRRRRRHRAHHLGPEAVIQEAWDEVCAELAWAGITRSPAETDHEFARRAAALLANWGHPGAAAAGQLAGLAALAGRATFAASTPHELADRTHRTTSEVLRQLRHGSTVSDRLRRALSLPPGRWARLTRVFRPG